MEKELKAYRGKLKIQNTIYVAAVCFIAALMVMSFADMLSPVVSNERWVNAWNGFIIGVSVSVIGFMILGFVINLRALGNGDRLKKLYVKEHDERSKAIAEKAGNSSYWFEALGFLLGVIIGGYFNITVSFVCLGCLMYMCLVRLVLKLYYCKKI